MRQGFLWAAAGLATILAVAGAHAQIPPGPAGVTPTGPTPEQLRFLHLAAANQLGVIEHCQTQGWVDAAVVDAQKRSMAMLPPVTNVTGLDAAEATGRNGTVMVAGTQTTLADAAKAQGTTEEALCRQIGSAIQSAVPK